MSKKQLVLLAYLTLALILAAFLVLLTGRKQFSGGKVALSGGCMKPFDVNAVNLITIEDSRSTLKIAKKNGMWVIPERASYPANFQMISDFVTSIKDLKPVRTLEPEKKYWRAYGLDISSGNRKTTTVDLLDSNGKSLAAVIMGDMYFALGEPVPGQPRYPVGRYMLADVPGAVPFLAARPFAEAAPLPALWLDRDFLKFQLSSINSVKCLTPSGKIKWELRKLPDKNEFTFYNPPKGKPLSVNKMQRYIRRLSEIVFDDVSPRQSGKEPRPDSIGTVVIEAGDVFYELHIGIEKEKYLMTVQKKSTAPGHAEQQTFFSKWNYEISPGLAEALTAAADSFFLAPEKEE